MDKFCQKWVSKIIKMVRRDLEVKNNAFQDSVIDDGEWAASCFGRCGYVKELLPSLHF